MSDTLPNGLHAGHNRERRSP